MAVFDNLKDTLNKGMTAVSTKSETLMESTRIRSAISAAQRKLESAQTSLGSKLYQSWKDGTLSMDLFTDDLDQIQQIEEEITSLNDRLQQIKLEEERILNGSTRSTSSPVNAGNIFCTNCGKQLPADSRFCDECGTPVV